MVKQQTELTEVARIRIEDDEKTTSLLQFTKTGGHINKKRG